MGSSLIGQLRILLGMETATLETGARRARKELLDTKAVAEGLKKSLELVGVTLGLTAFAEYAKGALEFASALDTTAKRIGVTVEQLQVMRKAARENGVASDIMEQGLARLNLRLGQAKAGLPAAVKAFKDIGISREQLQSFHNAGDVLPSVEEGLHKVGDGATQAAAAQELLSRAAINALPVFTMGKQAYDAMYDSAVKSGLITAEEAHKAHEAQDAIEDLAIALKTKLAIALSEDADEIVHFVDEIENMIGKIGDAVHFIEQLRTVMNKASVAGDDLAAKGRLLANPTPAGYRQYQAEHAYNQQQFNNLDRDQNYSDAQHKLGRFGTLGGMFPELVHHPDAAPPADNLDLSSHHKAKHQADHTEQREKEAERLKYELDKQELDGKKQLLEAQKAITVDTEDRNNIGLDILQVDHDARALEIQHNLKMVELDRTTSASAKAAAEASAKRQLELNDQLLLLHRQGDNLQAELDRQRDYDAVEQATLQAQQDRLQIEADLAKTMAERRRIELQMLDNAYDEKAAALKRIINDPDHHNETERHMASIQLASLQGNYGGSREKIIQGTAGPLDQWLRGIPDTTGKVREAIETDIVHAIGEANDSLAEFSASWIKLGGVAGNILRELYADMMKLILARAEKSGGSLFAKILGIGQQVAGAVGGSVSKSGSSTGTGDLKGFATGGSLVIGGMAGIDRNLLQVNGQAVARVGRGEKVHITPANDRSGGFGAYFDLRGAVVTQDILDQINTMGAVATVHGGQLGSVGAMTALRRKGERALPTGRR